MIKIIANATSFRKPKIEQINVRDFPWALATPDHAKSRNAKANLPPVSGIKYRDSLVPAAMVRYSLKPLHRFSQKERFQLNPLFQLIRQLNRASPV